MKQKDHLKITEEVIKRIAPSKQGHLKLLIAASGEHPDLEREVDCSHHSTHNLEQIDYLIRKARQEFLRDGLSEEFQRSLGYALHYIQDLLTIATPDYSLHGESLSLHNEIESKLSKYTDSIAYEGINPEPLEGEGKVLSFVHQTIEGISSPQYALHNPVVALERCFRTCVSVTNAVFNNERGFSKGSEAVQISDKIKRLTKRIRTRLDEMPGTVKETVLRTEKYVRSLEEVQEAKQWRRSFVQEVYYDTWLRSDLRKLHEMENWESELWESISKLNEIIESGYEQDYEIRQTNATWYDLGPAEFRTVQELKELVRNANEELKQARKERKELELHVHNEVARIGASMKNRIRELLAFGQIGLETGYYEQARGYFEQVLALDPSNQEAIDSLERIDEILRRKRATMPIDAQVPAEPPLAKRISDRAGSALEWIRKKREERIREIARQREEIARREKEKAEEIEQLKQAWVEQRKQRGNVPLQIGQCPECGSIDANKYKNVSGLGCLALLLTFPFSLLVYPLLPDAYRCNVCGAKWKG